MNRLALALVLCMPLSAPAQSAPETQAILHVLNQSADDWNRGDLDAFATSYKNSPDILFMGRTIQHGYAQMLAHYKAAYTNPAAMGKLAAGSPTPPEKSRPPSGRYTRSTISSGAAPGA